MTDLRSPELNEAEELLEIQNESLCEQAVEAYTAEQVAALTPPDQDAEGYRSLIENGSFRMLVAEEGGLIGFGGFHAGDCQIHSLYVSPNHAGEGVGTQILTEIECLARDEGCTELFGLVGLNAAEFYAEHGYERVGEEFLNEDPVIPFIRVEKTL